MDNSVPRETTSTAQPIRIGYLLKMYPRFSETFVVNEILELERQGLEIFIFSLKPPEGGRFHPNISLVQAPVTYLPEYGQKEFWGFLKESWEQLKAHSWNLQPALEYAFKDDLNKGMIPFMQALNLSLHLKKYEISRLHAHFASLPAYVAMLTTLISGIPYSFTAHAKDIYTNQVNQELLKDKIQKARFVITVSQFNRQHLLNLCGNGNESKIKVVYNGINLNLFSPDGQIPRENNLILTVGRLVPKKGFEDLIEACDILKKRGENFTCKIVGAGELEPVLRQKILVKNLQDQVELTGPKTQLEVIELMKQATLFCLPCVIAPDGNRDGLPTVLLEALAMGLPAVSTRLTGVPEIIDHNQDGLLVEPNSPKDLGESLRILLKDSALRERLSKNGIIKAQQKFNISTNVSVLKEYFLSGGQTQKV